MPSGLLRGIFRRSLLGYAVAGLVFGELYGSAFVGSISVRPNTVEGALGNALEWVIQRWVAWSGREVRTSQAPWLEGPVGDEFIGAGFYVGYATEVGREAVADDEDAGLLPDLGALAGDRFDPALVRPEIRDFYRRTARYDLCVRMEWSGPFRHPPRTLIYLVGRNIGQFDIPLSSSNVTMKNELIHLEDPATNEKPYAGWLRRGDDLLRDAEESDLPFFFEHQLDPQATHMAGFPARDRESFMAHWNRILEVGSVVKRTVLFEGEVAGKIVSFVNSGGREVGYWIGRGFWGGFCRNAGTVSHARNRTT